MKRALPLLLLLGCNSWEPADQQTWSLLPPVALDSRVAFVESTNARVFLVDPARPDAPARMVAVAKGPTAAVRHATKDELLVLSRGERGEPGVAPAPAALTIVPADASKATTVLTLASRFDTLSQSADGRYVVAHFTRESKQGEALFNPNEIAIADLGPGKAPTVTPLTLRSFGSVPQSVVFSPTMNLPDGPRTLAVILSVNFVTIVDLDHPTRTEITVPLTLPDDQRTVQPVQVLFETQDPAIYVRATGANDIYALRLLPVAAAERTPNGNDFTPALSQLAAGDGPADMALYDTADGPRLLVVSPGKAQAFTIDARSSRATPIQLDAAANRIFLFEATGPGDPKSRQRALLVDAGAGAQSIGFLDLDQLELQGRRNLDTRPMGAPALDALLFPASKQAVVLHGGSAGVSVIDLAGRTVSPIFAEAPPSRLAVDPAGTTIWVGAENGERLGFINLMSLAPGEVRLDAPVSAILPMPRGADGKNRLVVVHGNDPTGALTVLDGDKPERATARMIRGFLLQDLLERGDR